MRTFYIFLLLIFSIQLNAQKEEHYTYGLPSADERKMTIYANDSTANAVFLYEYGNTIFAETNSEIVVRTTYYAKLKIFNKEGFDHASVEIPIYHNSSSAEKVINVKAITHNGRQTTTLSPSAVFTEKINNYWSATKFTMPNVQAQSIIEYEYTLESPFKFNFTGWKFQAEIPKIYSEFHALVPGNYLYNRRLNGNLPLSKNISTIKRSCFSISGISANADCEELVYAMTNVPAFIDEEFMTSRKNHLASINFELSEFKSFDGAVISYTKTWSAVDREFKSEKSVGKQLKKVDYIKKSMPEELLKGAPSLQQAQKIYSFIKDHFTWNQRYRLFSGVDVKEAFKEKIGNATEINIALVNAFDAAGFDVELMLVATRDQGFPTKQHPVMTDFNYAIAKVNLNGKVYLLDARNKAMPFGLLPYELLNGYGRVMNFKTGSYWFDIIPNETNQLRTYLNLNLTADQGFTGTLNAGRSGYEAYYQRQKINEKGEDNYLNDFEAARENFTLVEYKNKQLADINENLTETYSIEIDNDLNENRIIFNPFFYSKFTKNPFNLNDRTYPVDFGYPRSNLFTLKMTIPEGMKVTSGILPTAIKLPNDGGSFQFTMSQNGQVINLSSKVIINRTVFEPSEYLYLKEFYNQILKTQKSLITLEKI